MSQQAPNHVTHTPVHVTVPTEDDVLVERARLPTPSLWQDGVQVTHKQDRERKGVVRRVDHVTRQFRLVGATRTQWESFDQWDVLVEKSQAEKDKDAALDALQAELATLAPDDLAAFDAFCDGDDPAKVLIKLNAMRKIGFIGKKVGEPAPATKGK